MSLQLTDFRKKYDNDAFPVQQNRLQGCKKLHEIAPDGAYI
jgi:hypothetical protein